MTLIDIAKLNKNKTYVVSEIGTSKIAKKIQSLEHRIYKDVPKNQLASHTLALRNINNIWYVWENHLIWKGIKQYSLEEYEKLNNNSSLKQVIITEYPLNLDAMDYWLKNNPGYSVTNLFEIATERLIGLKLPDTKGWVCSQAIAACNFTICNKLNIKFDDIAPADIQVFLKKLNQGIAK